MIVFPDTELIIINILYEWSVICQFELCFSEFSLVTPSNLIFFFFFFFFCFVLFYCFILFFLCIIFLLFWFFFGFTIKFNFFFFFFFVLFDYIAISNFFSVLYFHLFHMHVCFQSADCILFSSSALSTILLTSSANTLYFLLFILCCDFNWLSFKKFLQII